MPLTSGTRLGPYEIQSAIGAGGMGEVYRARDTRLERTVAVKVLPSHLSANVELKQRLDREAKAISGLQHPHICTLYDVGSQEGVNFLVMEYLEGQTLADRLEKGALPPDQTLKIAAQIAEAIENAHRQGIVHRDLKPANILFRADGRPVIVDFGLAKDLSATSTLTIAGQLLATPRYMSPEQCLNLPVDGRSDLYSLGVILYEMLTGERMYESANSAKVVNMHVNAPVPRLPEALSGHQGMLDRLLAKKPEDRFQSAREVFALISK
jgi:serine/threonine protein kinase